MCPVNSNNEVTIQYPTASMHDLILKRKFPQIIHTLYPTLSLHGVSSHGTSHGTSQGASKDSLNKIIIGIISGSFDTIPGRIVYGLLQEMRMEPTRNKYHIISMCFPTPRDGLTDALLHNELFDQHINLNPNNRYVCMGIYVMG